jgi:hypothetical protein
MASSGWEMRLPILRTLLVAAALPLACLSVASAQGLENKNVGEIKKEMGFLNARPSADTTPLYFKSGKVRYKIPRNYIVRMFDWSMRRRDDIVTMRVTYPGFEPYSEKTKDCLTKPPLYWPKGCFPVEFWIGVGKGDGDTGRVLTDEDKFNNARNLFHSQTPKPGPAAFEMYETGPDNARTETYRKKHGAQTIFIQCIIFDSNGKRNAICDNTGTPLSTGGFFSYRFYLDQMKDAEEIDTGLRKLVISFTQPAERP